MASRKKGTRPCPMNIVDSIDNTIKLEWHGEEIEITKTLSLQDMIGFVDNVVNSCIYEDGTYRPEIMEFAIRVNAVERYSSLHLPDIIEDKYDSVFRTDLFPFICEQINIEQLEDIKASVLRKISAILDINMRMESAKIQEASSLIMQIADTLSSAFGGVNSEDVQAIMNAIGDSGVMDKEALVAEFLKQKEAASNA